MALKGSLSNPEGDHLSEGVFRRYEFMIREFLEVFPEPYIRKPQNLSPKTVLSRFREAINAYLTHEDYVSNIDRAELREKWSKCIACIKSGNVVVSTREAQRAAVVELARVAQSSQAVTFDIHNPSIRTLDGLCILILEGAITIPIILHGDLPPYTFPPNVVCERNIDGTHTML